MAPWSGLRALTAKGLGSVPGGGLIAKSCPTLASPWAVACQGPPSMGFSRQEYWSGLPFPSPGDLPDPGIEPGSPVLQADFLLTELQGKPAIPDWGTKILQAMCSSPPKQNSIKTNFTSFNFFMKLELTCNTVFIFKVCNSTICYMYIIWSVHNKFN